MSCCHNTPCHKCDPGIEAFYQEKVKWAKLAAEEAAKTGYLVPWQDLLDAKDIWYEYCELRSEAQIEDAHDALLDDLIAKGLADEFFTEGNSWDNVKDNNKS